MSHNLGTSNMERKHLAISDTDLATSDTGGSWRARLKSFVCRVRKILGF